MLFLNRDLDQDMIGVTVLSVTINTPNFYFVLLLTTTQPAQSSQYRLLLLGLLRAAITLRSLVPALSASLQAAGMVRRPRQVDAVI
ncbi:hypothetical protein F4824DRAFT_500415 [Ustulina deusta]|nr:hypothetical protein F4824DRAFT_500415 [Ustulina deusta]